MWIASAEGGAGINQNLCATHYIHCEPWKGGVTNIYPRLNIINRSLHSQVYNLKVI